MYKHILCPIDGSETSNRGMTEAIALAKDQNAEVHFLHVVDNYFPIMDATGDFNFVDMTEILKESGKKIIQKANDVANLAGVPASSEMMISYHGQIYKSILECAKKCKADLIVMGTHGLRGFERLVMGSDAETVVRSSSVPVLLVRGKPKSN